MYCSVVDVKTRCVYVPTAEEDIVGPDHGQGEQLVQLLELILGYVPQDELPPGLPVFVTLPVASKRFHLLSQSSVLLNEILHVQGRHLALLQQPSQQQAVSGLRGLESFFSTASHSGGAENCSWPETPSAETAGW